MFPTSPAECSVQLAAAHLSDARLYPKVDLQPGRLLGRACRRDHSPRPYGRPNPRHPSPRRSQPRTAGLVRPLMGDSISAQEFRPSRTFSSPVSFANINAMDSAQPSRSATSSATCSKSDQAPPGSAPISSGNWFGLYDSWHLRHVSISVHCPPRHPNALVKVSAPCRLRSSSAHPTGFEEHPVKTCPVSELYPP